MDQEQIDYNYFHESLKDKAARLFEEEQRAKTKQERERIWMEQQRIYS